MTGFRNVLFAPMSDRGCAAATRRVVGAMAPESELTIAGVVSEPSRFQQLVHGAEHLDKILEAGHQVCERRNARCAAALDESSPEISVTSLVDVGHRAISLITRAIAAQHDLLAVAVDDDTEEALLRRLLRKSPCPVWVIRPSRAKRQRILAAIDPDPSQEEINTSIMDIAATLAGDEGELHLVNAWELYGESTMRSSAFIHIDDAEVDRRRSVVREAHESAVAEIVGGRTGDRDRWEVHVVKGPAHDVICDVVDRQRINTLVIGTIARSGVDGLVMGNTAERVIDDIRCSVVAVKPPGFVSPIHF